MEPHIGNGSRQMAVCHHTSHVQILNADGVEAAREIGRELVLGIIADVAAAGRQPRQLRLGFAAIGRAFLLAAQAARQAPRRLSNALCGLGPTLTSPVESAAQADTPKSTPTPPWFSAGGR